MLRGRWSYIIAAVAGFVLAWIVTLIILPPSPGAPERLRSGPGDPASGREHLLSTQAGTPAHGDVATDSLADSAALAEQAPLFDAQPTETARSMTAVPSLVGQSLDDARIMISNRQLIVVVRSDTSSWHAPNTILQQTPAPGDSVPVGSTVMITASRFPPRIQ